MREKFREQSNFMAPFVCVTPVCVDAFLTGAVALDENKSRQFHGDTKQIKETNSEDLTCIRVKKKKKKNYGGQT